VRRFLLALLLAISVAPALAQAPPPVPALPDSERRTQYTISGTTCACAVGFQIYGDGNDYGNWIEVFLNGILQSSASYTVTSPTGPLASIPRPITDAVLTFNSAQTGTVQIVGARRPRRISQFPESRGVAARDFNQVLTDIVAQNRETWDKINDVSGRALLSQPGNTLGMLPLPSACGGAFLGLDATGLKPICVPGPPSSGGGTVGAGLQNQIAVYPANGTAIGGTSSLFNLSILPPTAAIQSFTADTVQGPNSGTTTGTTSNATGGNSGVLYNFFHVDSESANPSAGGVPFTTALNVAMMTGGANSTGQKEAARVFLFHNSPSNAAVARDNIALNTLALSQQSEGGTGTSLVTAKGTLFAGSFDSHLASGATNYFEVAGAEVDIGIQTGGSAAIRYGWEVVDQANLQGAVQDGGFVIGSSGGPGWQFGVLFTNANGASPSGGPVASAGTLIGTDGAAATVANGIDFHTYGFTNFFIRGPTMSVSGNGDITTQGTYFSGATAGVTCSGTPTASFASTKGIVTHC
jgi:hypothetical protein